MNERERENVRERENESDRQECLMNERSGKEEKGNMCNINYIRHRPPTSTHRMNEVSDVFPEMYEYDTFIYV